MQKYQRKVKSPSQGARLLQTDIPVLTFPVLSVPVLTVPVLTFPVLTVPVLSVPVLSGVLDWLETVSFTESSIIFAINKLKRNLSSGPDNLSPLLFKQLKYCLAGPLSLLFTQLLSVGAAPEDTL